MLGTAKLKESRALPDIASREQFDVKRAAFAATIGNMLEFYDFITYTFFAIQIGRTFFPTQSEYGSLMLSLATFGAGFATRPIGGLVLGIYAARVGRRPTRSEKMPSTMPPIRRVRKPAPKVASDSMRLPYSLCAGKKVRPISVAKKL